MANKQLMLFCVFFTLFFMGCTPCSQEEFRAEGEAIARSLVQHFEKVHTKQDLERAAPHLLRQYVKLTKLILQAQDHPAHTSDMQEYMWENSEVMEKLLQQMQRLYTIAGMKEDIEKIQYEALVYLDKRERKSVKKRSF
jgi:hypothetical protein